MAAPVELSSRRREGKVNEELERMTDKDEIEGKDKQLRKKKEKKEKEGGLVEPLEGHGGGGRARCRSLRRREAGGGGSHRAGTGEETSEAHEASG